MNTTLVTQRDHRFARQNLALRELSRQYALGRRRLTESLHGARALLRHVILTAMSLGVVVYAYLAVGAN